MYKCVAVVALGMSLAMQVCADEVAVVVHEVSVEGKGGTIGQILLQDGEYGLMVMPALQGLEPGPYAVHVHEYPDCGPQRKHGRTVAAGAAGGHYDPEDSGTHAGPYRAGHLGDLPVLIAESDGQVTIPALAPRPTVAELRGRSIMIHHGADRYAEHDSHHHGMGGARMYCGVIEGS